MWWGIAGGVLYLALMVTLGLLTLREGHWVMFLFGIVLPVFWLVGALIAPTPRPSPT